MITPMPMMGLMHRNDGLILRTRYASALCLMLGALHLVVLRTTLAKESSSRLTCKRGAGNNPQVIITVAVAVAIEEASK